MIENKREQSTPNEALPDQPQAVAKFFENIFNEILERKTLDNIHSVYSNNAHFQSSELDFKILFGQLNQTPAKAAIDWHTAVTMAWAQVKMLDYYLRVNLAIYEATYGTIKVPAGMLPSSVTAPDDMATNPVSKKIFELVQKLQRELVDEQVSQAL